MSDDAGHFCGGGKWDEDGESAGRQDLSRYLATLESERQWRRLNRELWETEVEAWAMAEAAAGRRFSIQSAVERIRWKDRVDSQGQDLRVNDHYGAIWSRLLVKLHPELREYVEQRKSEWDSPELMELIS